MKSQITQFVIEKSMLIIIFLEDRSVCSCAFTRWSRNHFGHNMVQLHEAHTTLLGYSVNKRL